MCSRLCDATRKARRDITRSRVRHPLQSIDNLGHLNVGSQSLPCGNTMEGSHTYCDREDTIEDIKNEKNPNDKNHDTTIDHTCCDREDKEEHVQIDENLNVFVNQTLQPPIVYAEGDFNKWKDVVY